MVWLNRLIAQSGVALGCRSAAVLSADAAGLPARSSLLLGTRNPWLGVAPGSSLAPALPLFGLAFLRDRQLAASSKRSCPRRSTFWCAACRAGHPVSAAIRLVVRELPDPIGAEFAIAADEMTYGLDLETAIANVSNRVGQPDLALWWWPSAFRPRPAATSRRSSPVSPR